MTFTKTILILFCSLILFGITTQNAIAESLNVRSDEAHRKMLGLVLEDNAFSNAKNAATSTKEISRAKKLVSDLLKLESLPPFQSTRSEDGMEWYKYLSTEPGAGVEVQVDPDTGLGSVNVFDDGTSNGLPLNITLPTEPVRTYYDDDDNDDLFTPSPPEKDFDNIPIPSYESDDLFLENVTVTPPIQFTQREDIKDFKVDPDFAPTVMTQREFPEFIGSIDGYWQVGEEIWLIEAGETESGQILRDKKEIEAELNNVENQLRQVKKTSKVFIWQNIENPEDVVKQKRFKNLDIEKWDWLGEQTDPEQVPVIEKLENEARALNAMLSKNPDDTSFDPAGLEALATKGSPSLKISSVDGDCTYEMTRAYFDGRTLGAETSLDKVCALNTIFPDPIKSHLLTGGFPRTVISMMRVNHAARSGELQMSGRYWSRKVHYSIGSSTVNKVGGLFDQHSLQGIKLSTQLPTDDEICNSQFCEGRSCDYNAYLLQNLLDKEAIYNQYLQSLYAEEEVTGRLFEIQLANSKRSAARLEAARYATHILDFTSEMIGLLAEINGILATAYDPAKGFNSKTFLTTIQNPTKLFELLKDLESVAKRVTKAQSGLDKNVESIRYVEENKKLPKGALEKLPRIRGFKDLEDFFIDAYPTHFEALARASLSFKDKDSYLDGVAFIKQLRKDNTSNLVDALDLVEFKAAYDAFVQHQNNSIFAKSALNEAYRARNLGNVEQTTTAIKKYGKLQNAALESKKAARTKVGAAGFALAQIALRSVKTYYVDAKLKEFRGRIKDFRNNIMPVAENAISHGEKLSEVRDRIIEFRRLLSNTRLAISSLHPCMAENCDIDFESLTATTLPELERRSDGTIAYGLVQARLDTLLKDMELKDVQELAAENAREKTCPLDKDFVQKILDEVEISKCDQCEEYAKKESQLQKKSSFIREQIAAKIPGLYALNQLKIDRRFILDDMTRLQNEFLSVTQGTEDSGYSIVFTGNWFDDDEQTKQADLHNQIMENRVKLRRIKRQIQHIQRQSIQVTELEDELDAIQSEIQAVKNGARNCREEYCSK